MWTQLYLLPQKYPHNFPVLHIYSSSSKVHVQLSSSWKIFTGSFWYFECLVLWKQKGAKKRQLWTQRQQVIERWLLNSIIILVERTVRGSQCKGGLNYTWPVYRSQFTMTRSISYSVTYNYNLSYKHRYASFVKHVRSRFLFFFLSRLCQGTRCFDTKWNITWRSFTRIKTQAPRGKSRNEQLCSKKNGKL